MRCKKMDRLKGGLIISLVSEGQILFSPKSLPSPPPPIEDSYEYRVLQNKNARICTVEKLVVVPLDYVFHWILLNQ